MAHPGLSFPVSENEVGPNILQALLQPPHLLWSPVYTGGDRVPDGEQGSFHPGSVCEHAHTHGTQIVRDYETPRDFLPS